MNDTRFGFGAAGESLPERGRHGFERLLERARIAGRSLFNQTVASFVRGSDDPETKYGVTSGFAKVLG